MASFTVEPGERWYMFSQSALDELIANERAAEREACAKVADRHSTCKNDTPDVIANTIRARGQQ